MKINYRYVVSISFKQDVSFLAKRTHPIEERFKTLKEAQEYKSIVDNTVQTAFIYDVVTNKIIEHWNK